MTPASEIAATITGLILAGGHGSRVIHRDKGRVPFLNGRSLVQHLPQRLQPQVASMCISANRNLQYYRALGLQVVTDAAVQEPVEPNELRELHKPN